jgi:outer membrane protein assembly factor BamB
MTGKPLWTFLTGAEVDSSPVLCGDQVLVGSSDGKLYCLSVANGKLTGSFDAASAILSGPAIADNCILIACEDGTVYALQQAK